MACPRPRLQGGRWEQGREAGSREPRAGGWAGGRVVPDKVQQDQPVRGSGLPPLLPPSGFEACALLPALPVPLAPNPGTRRHSPLAAAPTPRQGPPPCLAWREETRCVCGMYTPVRV